MIRYGPEVLLDGQNRPLIVFARGRTLYHAVAARDTDIALVTLQDLRGLRSATRREDDYPARRAASYWLRHDWRPITPRAKAVLRGLVARTNHESGTTLQPSAHLPA